MAKKRKAQAQVEEQVIAKPDSSSEEEEEEEEEEDDDELKKETMRKLLEPFGKEQILDLLKEAALKNPSIIARITQSAESDPAHRNVFIHGLGWDATTEQVLSIFKPFGEIEECKVVTDKVTGRAKGYGFVLFKTRIAAQKALKQRQKKIGNRMASCQLASAGVPNNQAGQEPAGRKIYVANVGSHVNPEKLRSFFAKFGEIEEGPLGHDPVTGKLKGFAIFIYKNEKDCKKALEEPVKVFEGIQMQCRRAAEGRNNKNQAVVLGASVGGGGVASIQQSEINTMNYGLGMNPGILGQNVNTAAVMMGQNPGIGLANPMMASALNQTGLPPSMGANPSLGFSGNYGINSVNPSLMGSYGSQAALQGSYGSQAALQGNYGSQAAMQGLGAYQNAQLGHSSAGATAAAATRPQSGFGSAATTFPSYFGR
ncbi:unnamed protein product [Camellia sinensis]